MNLGLPLFVGLMLFRGGALAAEAGLGEFVARVLAEGEARPVPSIPRKLLGLPRDSLQRALNASPDESADGFERSFAALVARSTDGPNAGGVVLKAYRRDLRRWEVERVLLRLSPEGTLLRAVVGKGDILASGAEKKSFAPRDIKPSSAAAQELIRRELDFWLHGTGRRLEPAAVKPGP